MLKMSVLNVPAVQRSFLLMPVTMGQYQRIGDSSAELQDDHGRYVVPIGST
jgi:hypothetical protein